MTTTIRGRVILNIVWIIIAVIFYWVSIPYANIRTLDPIGPHVFPQIMSIIIIICALGNLLVIPLSKRYKKKKKEQPQEQEEGVGIVRIIKIILVIATSGLYILIMPWAGYLISTILLIFALILIQGEIDLKQNILISCSFAIVLYLLFSKVLNILLPNSFLEII